MHRTIAYCTGKRNVIDVLPTCKPGAIERRRHANRCCHALVTSLGWKTGAEDSGTKLNGITLVEDASGYLPGSAPCEG